MAFLVVERGAGIGCEMHGTCEDGGIDKGATRGGYVCVISGEWVCAVDSYIRDD